MSELENLNDRRLNIYIQLMNKNKKTIKLLILLTILSLVVTIGFAVSSWRSFKKLNMDYDTTIIIEDEDERLEDTDYLYNKMVEFQEATGVTPAMVVVDEYDIGIKEVYAKRKYEELFDDENHFLMIYVIGHSVYSGPDDNGDYVVQCDSYTQVVGKNAEKIIDSYALKDFNPSIISSSEDGTYFAIGGIDLYKTYSDELDEIIKNATYSGPTNEYVLIPAGFSGAFIISLVVFIFDQKSLKKKLVKEDEYITSE